MILVTHLAVDRSTSSEFAYSLIEKVNVVLIYYMGSTDSVADHAGWIANSNQAKG